MRTFLRPIIAAAAVIALGAAVQPGQANAQVIDAHWDRGGYYGRGHYYAPPPRAYYGRPHWRHGWRQDYRGRHHGYHYPRPWGYRQAPPYAYGYRY